MLAKEMQQMNATIAETKAKIENHFRENKKVYIAAGAGVLTGAAATLVIGLKSASARGLIVQGLNWHSPSTNTINNLVTVTRAAKGPLGNAVVRLSDGQPYRSQRDAALQNGIDSATLRHHLRGETPDAGGEKFRILREAVWN